MVIGCLSTPPAFEPEYPAQTHPFMGTSREQKKAGVGVKVSTLRTGTLTSPKRNSKNPLV